MTKLGEAILNAMREQGWLVIFVDDAEYGPVAYTVSPAGASRWVPMALLDQEELEHKLRIVLLAGWIITDELQWPWPPDHHPEVNGEVPSGGE